MILGFGTTKFVHFLMSRRGGSPSNKTPAFFSSWWERLVGGQPASDLQGYSSLSKGDAMLIGARMGKDASTKPDRPWSTDIPRPTKVQNQTDPSQWTSHASRNDKPGPTFREHAMDNPTLNETRKINRTPTAWHPQAKGRHNVYGRYGRTPGVVHKPRQKTFPEEPSRLELGKTHRDSTNSSQSIVQVIMSNTDHMCRRRSGAVSKIPRS